VRGSWPLRGPLCHRLPAKQVSPPIGHVKVSAGSFGHHEIPTPGGGFNKMLSCHSWRRVALPQPLFVVHPPNAVQKSPNTDKSRRTGFTSAGLLAIDCLHQERIARKQNPGAHDGPPREKPPTATASGSFVRRSRPRKGADDPTPSSRIYSPMSKRRITTVRTLAMMWSKKRGQIPRRKIPLSK